MFLHLGANVAILNQEVIAILDYRTIKEAFKDKKIFYQPKNMINISKGEKIKSIVLTEGTVYFSPISSLTLQGRSKLGDLREIIKGEAYGQ